MTPPPLPDGWEREDVDRGVGARTWLRATDEDLDGIEIEITAEGVMVHGLDAWTEWQYHDLLELRRVLAAAASRHLELRRAAPTGGAT